MSLSDKESHESQSLRRLLIGYSPDEIDLTTEGSPLVITHKPSLCSARMVFNDARQIASDHPDLTGGLESEFGYVQGSVFATLEIGEQRHLEEIARLVDKHLKKVHDDELARMTKDAANKD